MKRLVVKLGSSTITYPTGHLNIRRLRHLVRVMVDVKNSGVELCLVTSGAVALGMGKLGLSGRPSDMPGKQAAAAVGQCELMYLYDKEFSAYNHNVAQLLLTRDVIEDRDLGKNVKNTFTRLLEMGVIPIVNENDTVSVEEIEFISSFGDNDNLSAIVAELIGADTLVIMSDIDGLFDKDPSKYSDAKLIPVVDDITEDIKSLCGDTEGSLGTGGMITKIAAAETAGSAGVTTYIVNGSRPENLYKVMEEKPVGTKFIPKG